ncbi:hypothetical protein BH09MYX1_BH09MYX1_19800 [soil metagenome]
MNRFHILALSSVVAVASSACIIQSNNTQAAGTFEIDWTINGQNNSSSLCNQSAVATIEVVVTRNGATQGTYTSSCANFATYVDFQPGSYAFAATLLDSAGNARTTTASNTFVIYSNQRTIVPVDFPPSSFF